MQPLLRIVMDTNVLISALLAAVSVPGRSMTKAEDSGLLLASAELLAELDEVLRRPRFSRYLSIETRVEFLKRYKQAVQIVSIVTPVRACRDPSDDKFLEAAVNGEADLIVTGDADLLVLDPFKGLRILSPQGFLGFSPQATGERKDE